MACDHGTLAATFTVDQDDATWLATVKIRCSDCSTLFSFRGIPSGPPSQDTATVTADAYELRLPIVPGPGATVGLLAAVGLSDRLIDPALRKVQSSEFTE